ncbi:family 2 glycosyltransferase [Melampsora larici-populina 98AG31]|uniref:Family 2 glycosyltransferase n=1 Tax=Melampsora larici-populina (strain 98AG31 / pathotype 3-4-7) TaxID=747676 RepID=F4R5W8_MELLP|nr:family 2 glycosyltransferase [Melampsora larici-populina 98AG31]EGG12182.1 family 2 glycosyltransferase [Melampsora larici-populina 98AG31]
MGKNDIELLELLYKPGSNVVMGASAQIASKNLATYFEVETRLVPVLEETNYCLDPRHAMEYIITGVSPGHHEICLMVDADTQVFPDSVSRMAACMVRDSEIMRSCGETKCKER